MEENVSFSSVCSHLGIPRRKSSNCCLTEGSERWWVEKCWFGVTGPRLCGGPSRCCGVDLRPLFWFDGSLLDSLGLLPLNGWGSSCPDWPFLPFLVLTGGSWTSLSGCPHLWEPCLLSFLGSYCCLWLARWLWPVLEEPLSVNISGRLILGSSTSGMETSGIWISGMSTDGSLGISGRFIWERSTCGRSCCVGIQSGHSMRGIFIHSGHDACLLCRGTASVCATKAQTRSQRNIVHTEKQTEWQNNKKQCKNQLLLYTTETTFRIISKVEATVGGGGLQSPPLTFGAQH